MLITAVLCLQQLQMLHTTIKQVVVVVVVVIVVIVE